MNKILLVLLLLLHCGGARSQAQVDNNGRKIDSLKRVLSGRASDSARVLVLLQLSQLQPAANCAEKLRYANQAGLLSEKAGWVAGVRKSLNEVGMINRYCIKDYDAAIVAYERLVRFLTARNATEQLEEAYTDLARAHKVAGQYSTSLSYYYEILKLNPGNSAVMSTLGNIGQIYSELGDYTRALNAYLRSLQILSDTIIADKSIPDGYLLMRSGLEMTIADIYIETGEYDKALRNYNGALNVQHEHLRSMAYSGIGKTYFLKGNTDESILYYGKALEMTRANDNTLNTETILDALANCYIQKHDIATAASYAMQAKTVALSNNNEPMLIQIYTTLGKIARAERNYERSVGYLTHAIGIAQKTGAKNDEKKAWEVLSTTYAAMKRPDKALDAYKKFITLRDSVYSTEKAREITRIDLQGAFDRKQAADSVKQAAENKLTTLRMQRQRIMIYSGFSGVALLLLLAFFIYRSYIIAKRSNITIKLANEQITEEQQISEKLLLNIIPSHVAKELKAKGNIEAKRFENVTILFTDFVSFTTVSERLMPEALVAELHTCFKAFDEIIGKYQIEKIKTIGDAYLAASGLPYNNPNHATDIVKAALEIRDFMQKRRRAMGVDTFGIRLGVNTGSVVAGIVGVTKFAYDIWGDAVNTAARMEQSSEDGKINISQATYELVKDEFLCTYRGALEAKNKGKMSMYFVETT